MNDIETMIEDAARHGRDSDPDHEVGDLQTLARALWDALTPDARARVAGAWRSWDAEDDHTTMQRERARVVVSVPPTQIGYEILTGRFAGDVWIAGDIAADDAAAIGTECEVTFHPQDQFANRVAPRRAVDDVRAILAQRAAIVTRPGWAGPVSMLCCDDCQGWAVFATDRGFEVQACDECNTLAPYADRLSDSEVGQLPEALEALASANASE